MRRVAILVIGAWALASTACCCKQSPQNKVNSLQAEVTRLRFELDATTKANTAARDYVAELKTGAGKEPIFSMIYTAADLGSMAAQTLPYRINAKEFNNDLSGEVVIDQIYGFAFAPGNRLACKMKFHGERIDYHGNVPGMFKQMVEDFKAGIAVGAIADLDVLVSFDGTSVKALAKAENVHMLKNSSANSEGQLKDQMNQTALNSPVFFDVHIDGHPAPVRRVVITQNDVVVSYAPPAPK